MGKADSELSPICAARSTPCWRATVMMVSLTILSTRSRSNSCESASTIGPIMRASISRRLRTPISFNVSGSGSFACGEPEDGVILCHHLLAQRQCRRHRNCCAVDGCARLLGFATLMQAAPNRAAQSQSHGRVVQQSLWHAHRCQRSESPSDTHTQDPYRHRLQGAVRRWY